MKTKYCRECGIEIEMEEGSRRRPRLCPSCERIEAMEKALLKEWEREQIG